MQPHPLAKIIGQNWLDLGKIKAKFGQNCSEIRAKVIRFGQNQNLASPKNIRSPMAMHIGV